MNKRLKAILARRNALRTLAENEGREYTAEESQELTALAEEAATIQAQIEQDRQFDALEADMNAGQGRRTGADQPGANQGQEGDDPDLAAMGGFASEGEFFQSVRAAAHGDIDPRLMAAANVNGNNGGEEGFSLPPAMRGAIFTILGEDTGDLLGRVTSEVTGANSVAYLKNVTMPWEAAGIKTHWEHGDKKFEPTKFNALTAGQLKLNGLSVFITVDEDLLDDAPRLAQRMMEMAPAAMRWTINEAIRYGDGVGKPEGYMESEALIVVAKESGQAAKSITADNIAKMYTRLLPGSIQQSHWEINPELLPDLMKLKDEAGNLLWTPLNSGYKDAPNGLLLGRPVIFNEHPEAAGAQGDIQLIDPSGYYLAMRTAAAKYAESMHIYFDQGLKCFRWRLRLDGKTILSKPVRPAKGDLTKSHFVTLAKRA